VRACACGKVDVGVCVFERVCVYMSVHKCVFMCVRVQHIGTGLCCRVLRGIVECCRVLQDVIMYCKVL